MAPPTEPGIQDKNSKPLKEFSLANLAKFLSKVAAPTSIIFGSDILILANLGLNLSPSSISLKDHLFLKLF